MNASSRRAVIVGPSGAGKTYMLAAMRHAALNRTDLEQRRLRFEVEPVSESCFRIFENAADFVLGRRRIVPGSTKTERYEFRIRTATKVFGLFPSRQVMDFSLLDGPGGALFRDDDQEADADEEANEAFRRELVQEAQGAQAMMLCVDAANPTDAFKLAKYLPTLLARIGNPLPCERFVVVLSKADIVFAARGNGARRSVGAEDPMRMARRLLTRVGINALDNYCDPRRVEVGFCWGSTHGFLDSGAANYNTRTHGPLVVPRAMPGLAPDDIVEAWRPYHVVEPFAYLASGSPLDAVRVWRGRSR